MQADDRSFSGEAATDARVVKTRRALKDALLELLATVDYSKITVSEISRRASINRKTFYAHFASVDELLASIVEDEILVMCQKAMADAESLQGSGEVGLLSLTRSILNAFDRVAPIGRGLLEGIDARRLLLMVKDPIERAVVADRRNRGLPDLPQLEYYVAGYIGGLLAMYGEWYEHPEPKETLDDMARLVYESALGRLRVAE